MFECLFGNPRLQSSDLPRKFTSIMGMRIIKTSEPLRDPDVMALRSVLRGGQLTAAGEAGDLNVTDVVSEIVEAVVLGGDQSVASLTSRLDQADITANTLRVDQQAIDEAHAAAEPSFLELVRTVAENIRSYQEQILVRPPEDLVRGGRRMGVKYTPVDRVGVYAPGGRALYPSSMLMTIIPAQVAGVGEIAMASPPTAGEINPIALALAGELGIHEVYRMGGAVAIAAMAFGTESIKPVQKIAGPGNAFVAEAKRQVMGKVGIDSIAGPSEVLIVADETARPDWLAADLLAQAEHNPGSAILVTTSAELADKVAGEVAAQLPELDRRESTAEALTKYSAIIVVDDMDAACDLTNDFAPEHVQVITADQDATAARIRNAGAIFIGAWTPVPVGDYYAGPSHVLPTGGTAKFFSPLSCNDFRKATSTVCYDEPSLAEDAADVMGFARREGLTAHARAIDIRTKKA